MLIEDLFKQVAKDIRIPFAEKIFDLKNTQLIDITKVHSFSDEVQITDLFELDGLTSATDNTALISNEDTTLIEQPFNDCFFKCLMADDLDSEVTLLIKAHEDAPKFDVLMAYIYAQMREIINITGQKSPLEKYNGCILK